MADIFLSYADHDLETVRPLAKALDAEGWSVFWDREIPLGKTWRQVLDDELSAARCVIVVWTETSVDRRWVLEEAEEGHRRGILIPVFMDRVEAPRGFRGVQGATLLDWKGQSTDTEFVRLCGACRDLIGPPGTPPTSPQPEPSAAPEKHRRARVSRLAVALGLLLVIGGSWLWYFAVNRQPDSTGDQETKPVSKTDSLAAALRYQEACNEGSAEDCYNLGSLYAAGRGVGMDALRAAALYQQACDGKMAAACIDLGALYEEGRGVAKDDERATKLYQQACDVGTAEGCERVERLDERRRAAARQPPRATDDATTSEPVRATPELKAQKRPARLKITVSPWGDIWIDGQYKQRAPWNVSLKPGTYTIGVGRGTPSQTRVVRLKPGEHKSEHFDLSD